MLSGSSLDHLWIIFGQEDYKLRHEYQTLTLCVDPCQCLHGWESAKKPQCSRAGDSGHEQLHVHRVWDQILCLWRGGEERKMKWCLCRGDRGYWLSGLRGRVCGYHSVMLSYWRSVPYQTVQMVLNTGIRQIVCMFDWFTQGNCELLKTVKLLKFLYGKKYLKPNLRLGLKYEVLTPYEYIVHIEKLITLKCKWEWISTVTGSTGELLLTRHITRFICIKMENEAKCKKCISAHRRYKSKSITENV